MLSIHEQKIRFSDAVHAIGRTQPGVRNWIQRKQVRLHSDGADGWRTFSFVDIAVLAVISKLVEFGMVVETANDMAHAVLGMFPDAIKSAEIQPSGLAAMWHNRTLVIWRASEKSWQMRLIDNWSAPKPLCDDKGEPIDAFMTIDVELTLTRALARIAESAGRARRRRPSLETCG